MKTSLFVRSEKSPGQFSREISSWQSEIAHSSTVRAPQAMPQAGVTLIELLIVITIAAILMAIAAPSFSRLVNDTRHSSTLIQIVSDLNQARSEAIKRNSRMLICVRNTAGTDCAAGTNWQVGWVICADADGDSACDASTTDNPNPVIVRPALNSQLTLTGSANSVRFNPNSTQGTGTPATLTLVGTWSGATARVVTIAKTGNISK